MAMNLWHRMLCSSDRWAATVQDQLIPWVLAGVDLGDSVLEIGPGYGANLRALVDKTPRYSAVEIDAPMAQRLRDTYGGRARIITGDGTDTGLPADEFSSVVCFTMLHHVPTAALQDRLFAEAFRVLRPGAVFAGSDSVTSLRFRLLHLRDTCNPVLPASLPERLRAAGFHDMHVDAKASRLRWRAVKPWPRKCNCRRVYSGNASPVALSRSKGIARGV
jgi:SAM-dependent methyltransferase